MGMSIPYELNGRVDQKRRTRDALIAAARELVASGETPTVEGAAEAASISRTTAYRYFPNQRALLVAAHPETGAASLLPDDAPDDAADSTRPRHRRVHPLDRRERGAAAHDAPTLARSRPGGARHNCRCAKVAASSGSKKRSRRSARTCPTPSVHRLALAIRSATGIEALVWLTDVAGLSRDDATELMRWSGPRSASSPQSPSQTRSTTPPASTATLTGCVMRLANQMMSRGWR